MNWVKVNTVSQLEEINALSFSKKGVLLFKHSTRCSISSMVLNRLETGWKESQESIPTYFIDLIIYRTISQKIAKMYEITHESPQVLIIKNGMCVYNASHSEINASTILSSINLNE